MESVQITNRCTLCDGNAPERGVFSRSVPFGNSSNDKTLAFFLGSAPSAEIARGLSACPWVLTTRGSCQWLAFGAASVRGLVGAAYGVQAQVGLAEAYPAVVRLAVIAWLDAELDGLVEFSGDAQRELTVFVTSRLGLFGEHDICPLNMLPREDGTAGTDADTPTLLEQAF